MSKTEDSLRHLRIMLADHLDAIRRLFRDEIKITLIIRNTQYADRDVVMGDDAPDEVIQAMSKLLARKHIHVPPDMPGDYSL